MTFLLLQTFLLLSASYFLGALLACIAKKLIMPRAAAPLEYDIAEPAPVPVRVETPRPSPRPAPYRAAQPVVAPRTFDPVQPRIEVLQRPAPHPPPKMLDPLRFERALMGPDPNEGMPRRAICEIRPKVLKSPTGPARPKPVVVALDPAPVQPEPVTQPEPVALETEQVAEPVVAETQAAVEEVVTITPAEESVPDKVADAIAADPLPEKRGSRFGDMTTAAATAAIAAAKAAAAALGRGRPSRTTVEKPADEQPVESAVTDTESASEPADETTASPAPAEAPAPEPKAPEPAPAPVPLAPIAGGDDFQRIRAIDADTEQKLKHAGVMHFDHMASWASADVKKYSQMLGLGGRIDREQWVEQAQILAKGGETYYSRNRASTLKIDVLPEKYEQQALEVEAATPVAPQGVGSQDNVQSDQPKADVAAVDVPVKQPTPSAIPAPLPPSVAVQGKSVAEMAAAAAAAIAAASASVTRGIRPIEPISPLSKVNPKINIPAKLTDAIKVKEERIEKPVEDAAPTPVTPKVVSDGQASDDLKRIRGIGVLIEKRLNGVGITRYEHIANWENSDIDRISQMLEFKGRIEREGWVEQARILASGGQTEFAHRVDKGEVDTSRDS